MWLGTASRKRYAVALDLRDADLRDALAEALETHPALAPADPGTPPDLTLADHPDPPAAPVLRLDDGPLPPDAPLELILSAAHLAAAGLQLRPAPEPVRTAARLSPREREVLALLVEGASNKAIARSLDISVRTAKFHVAGLLAKLGARSRGEATALAFRDGLVML
jgi:DNA-binding CsgD family transcriptional regulator